MYMLENPQSPMQNLRRVTVAIPTLNRLELLKRAVESALLQGYEDLEIIISDNASTDGTQQYLQDLRDPRIKVLLNPENLGMVANWGRCLNAATGAFFLLLSDDDAFVDQDAVAKVMRHFCGVNGEKIGVVFSDVVLERVSRNTREVTSADKASYSAADLIVRFYANEISVFPCATYMRTKDLKNIGGYHAFDAKLAVDACAWMAVALTYGHVERVPEPLSLYRVHESLTSSPVEVWSKDFDAVRTVVSKYQDRLTPREYRLIQKSIDAAWNRVPVGYIAQRFKYDIKYDLRSAFRDAFRWRDRFFTLSNINFLLKKLISRY